MTATRFSPRFSRSIPLADADATAELARRIAPRLVAGDTLLLHGPIGAGKSHFARALLQHRMAACGRIEDVPSPTFTLVQVYDLGGVEAWHCDLYRLSSSDEVLELGLEDAFETAICLIEWPDRLGVLLPECALNLELEQDGDGRIARLHGPDRWHVLLEETAFAPAQ